MPRAVHDAYWQHRTFGALAAALGYDVSEPEEILERPILPARFRYLAIRAYKEAEISLAKLAELLRENYYDLRDKLKAAGELDSRPAAVG